MAVTRAGCLSPPPSTSIQSDTFMRPVSRSIPRQRRSSEPKDNLTTLQPRRKRIRLQLGVPTPIQSPETAHPSIHPADHRLTSVSTTAEVKQPKATKGQFVKRVIPRRSGQARKHKESDSAPTQGQTYESHRQPLPRSPQSRKSTASKSHIVKNKDSHRAQGQESQQDTALLRKSPLSTSVGAAQRDEDTGKRTAGQPIPKPSPSGKSCAPVNTLGRRSAKRQRPLEEEQEPEAVHGAKRVKSEPQLCIGSTAEFNDNSLVTDWVLGHSWSHQSSALDQIPELSATMSRKSQLALPSPRSSLAGTETSSKKSERSSASVHDTDYHNALKRRNVFIENDDPPSELMRRAHRIIARSRASPEMDDTDIQKIREKSRRHRNDAEDIIIKQMAPFLIPAMNEVPDRRLEMNANQPWSNSVPVPLDVSVLTNPLPLPKPMPDLAFGYSETAFTRNQLGTFDLLVDDHFGRSYAVPDRKLRFPFLAVEFKSQAKSGTHYVATNQAAGAGAIAMNGTLELMQRSFGWESYDYNEPQFFSVTLDHELARINVHWLKAPSGSGQHSFHVEGLSKHLLDDPTSIRKIVRAIKNILDYSTDTRLDNLCGALDAYRESVVRGREAATTKADSHEPRPATRDRRSDRTSTNPTGWLPPPKMQQDDGNPPLRGPSPHLPAGRRIELEEPAAAATTSAVRTRCRRRMARKDAQDDARVGSSTAPSQNKPLPMEGKTDSSTEARQTRSSSTRPPVEVNAV